MDRGAWWAAVHGVTRSWTRLSDFTFTFMHWRRKWQPTPVFPLENLRDGGAWWASVSGVAQSRTQLKRLSSSNSSSNLSQKLKTTYSITIKAEIETNFTFIYIFSCFMYFLYVKSIFTQLKFNQIFIVFCFLTFVWEVFLHVSKFFTNLNLMATQYPLTRIYAASVIYSSVIMYLMISMFVNPKLK